jgi:hypothetical protein
MRKTSHPSQPALPNLGHRQASDAGSLESELAWLAVVVARRNRRNAEILISRWGLDGKGGATLQEVGDRYSLTRERVRQIENKARNVLASKDVELPYLDRAIALLNDVEFDAVAHVEDSLRISGIARRSFAIDGIVEVATICGRKCSAVVVEVQGIRVIGRGKLKAAVSWLLAECRRRASKMGVVNIPDLAESATARFRILISEEAVRRVCGGVRGKSWLDDDKEWLWFPDAPRNRLRNQIWKVLSVTEALPLTDLREAVRRWHRMQGFAPPRRILQAFCEELPGVRVESNRVIGDARPQPEKILGGNELTLVAVLRENGGVMNRADLEAECVARGLNVSSFYIYLTYSPLLERLAGGVYALRGARVLPGQVDELKTSARPGENVRDFGWTEDGRVWIAYAMSHSNLVTGVVPIPGGFKEVLQGDYTLKGPEGDNFGDSKCRDGKAWGLGKFWRRRGGDEGDPFVLIFSLAERTVSVFLGAEDLEDVLSRSSVDIGALDAE